MPLPTHAKIWTISPNNRIVFASLLQVQQDYLHAIKTFLKANSYTVKGSCSAGVGAMDAVDRWTLTTDVTPRGATQASSNAWIVLTDVHGGDLCLSFAGGTDDVARFSYDAQGDMALIHTSGPITMAINSAAKTWTRTLSGGNSGSGSFLLDGFAIGQTFTSAGWSNAGNNGNFVISAVTATVITATTATGLVTESALAGTSVTDTVSQTTHTPTAPYAALICNGSTIGATASGDRVYHTWIDSEDKLFRIAIGRAGVVTNIWGVELISSGVGSTAVFAPAVWSFFQLGTLLDWGSLFLPYALNSRGGFAYVVLGGLKYLCPVGAGHGGTQAVPQHFDAGINEVNDNSHPLTTPPYGIISDFTGCTGRIGGVYDWWFGYTSPTDGDTYTGLTLIHVGDNLVWPWNGVTTPTYT